LGIGSEYEEAILVEPAGFEPATFPVSPGRAQQLLDEVSILLPLDLRFASDGFTPRGIFLRINKLPGSAIPQSKRVIGVVIGDSLGQILCLPDIIPPAGFALEDIDMEFHAQSLVEPAGFEPATSSMPSRRAPNCATAPRSRTTTIYFYSTLQDTASNEWEGLGITSWSCTRCSQCYP
jgi:hypothetical protein